MLTYYFPRILKFRFVIFLFYQFFYLYISLFSIVCLDKTHSGFENFCGFFCLMIEKFHSLSKTVLLEQMFFSSFWLKLFWNRTKNKAVKKTVGCPHFS